MPAKDIGNDSKYRTRFSTAFLEAFATTKTKICKKELRRDFIHLWLGPVKHAGSSGQIGEHAVGVQPVVQRPTSRGVRRSRFPKLSSPRAGAHEVPLEQWNTIVFSVFFLTTNTPDDTRAAVCSNERRLDQTPCRKVSHNEKSHRGVSFYVCDWHIAGFRAITYGRNYADLTLLQPGIVQHRPAGGTTSIGGVSTLGPDSWEQRVRIS